jgi:hypothetical protein
MRVITKNKAKMLIFWAAAVRRVPDSRCLDRLGRRLHRRPGGAQTALNCAGFWKTSKKRTKQLSVDFGAAARDTSQSIGADHTVDSTAVSRCSAPAPRASRNTGRRTSRSWPAFAGAWSRPRASFAARPCGEPLVWSACAPYIPRISCFALGSVADKAPVASSSFSPTVGPGVAARRTAGAALFGSTAAAAAGDLDPAVEGVILRCLQADPPNRPASGAGRCRRRLPGGDPLGAALASGETPSPETEGVRTGVAVPEPGFWLARWPPSGNNIAIVIRLALSLPTRSARRKTLALYRKTSNSAWGRASLRSLTCDPRSVASSDLELPRPEAMLMVRHNDTFAAKNNAFDLQASALFGASFVPGLDLAARPNHAMPRHRLPGMTQHPHHLASAQAIAREPASRGSRMLTRDQVVRHLLARRCPPMRPEEIGA